MTVWSAHSWGRNKAPDTPDLRIEPHRQPGPGHVLLGGADRMLAEMEDRGGKNSAGMAVTDTIDEMIERAHAARGDDRHRHRIRDRAGERDVEALAGAVTVHRGQEDLTGAKRDHLACISHGVEPGRLAPAMGENLPTVGLTRLRDFLRIDRYHDALIAEFLRRLLHEGAPLDRRGVDRHLVGAGREQVTDILDSAHAAADGERHEASLRR